MNFNKYTIKAQEVIQKAAEVASASQQQAIEQRVGILEIDTSQQPFTALSVQYTGWGATFEFEAFRRWQKATNLDEFVAGLQYFDVGSQNFGYADVDGNIAYFTSAEMPIRSDLHQGTVAPGTVPGLFPPGVPIPPWFIRDGTSGDHEWLPVQNPQDGQAIAWEILTQEEMPQTVNPPAGWFVNANIIS